MARIFQTADLTEDIRLTPDENSWIYCGLDSAVTREILDELLPLLDEVTTPTYEFALAKQAPFLEMQLRGVLNDPLTKREIRTAYLELYTRLERELKAILHDGLGLDINWRSPKQLLYLFYDVLGLPKIRKRNSAGVFAPTVNMDALERLSVHFYAMPLATRIIALRVIKKKIDFLDTGIDTDGRIRTSYNLAGTETGRLSSRTSVFGTGGNLQNVDRLLRRIFVADPGMLLVNIDIEQGDSRNFGALMWNTFLRSRGPEFAGSYLDACDSGDLHTYVSKMVWPNLGWFDDPVLDKQLADSTKFYREFTLRDTSKRLGHGTNFRGTAAHMARELRIEQSLIDVFQYKYFTAFPCIPAYHKWVPEQLKEFGFLKTLFGRRRFFYGRHNDDRVINKAVAYAPQGSTAEEIDSGILFIWRKYPNVQLLLQVHDSILLQLPIHLASTLIPQLLEDMKTPILLEGGRPFCVPFEAKTGFNWGDVERDSSGREIGNFEGMRKWKGTEDRQPPERSLSFRALMIG